MSYHQNAPASLNTSGMERLDKNITNLKIDSPHALVNLLQHDGVPPDMMRKATMIEKYYRKSNTSQSTAYGTSSLGEAGKYNIDSSLSVEVTDTHVDDSLEEKENGKETDVQDRTLEGSENLYYSTTSMPTWPQSAPHAQGNTISLWQNAQAFQGMPTNVWNGGQNMNLNNTFPGATFGQRVSQSAPNSPMNSGLRRSGSLRRQFSIETGDGVDRHIPDRAYAHHQPELMSDTPRHGEHQAFQQRRSQVRKSQALAIMSEDTGLVESQISTATQSRELEQIEMKGVAPEKISLCEHPAPWPISITPLDSPKFRVNDFQQKIGPILDEFFLSGDYEGLKHEILELQSPSHHDSLVAVFFRKFLDLREEGQIETTRSTLIRLCHEGVVDRTQLTRGIFRWVVDVEDLELDVPYAATNLALFLEELCEENLVEESVFARLPEYVLSNYTQEVESRAQRSIMELTEEDISTWEERRRPKTLSSPKANPGRLSQRESKMKDVLSELRLFKKISYNLLKRYFLNCYELQPVADCLKDLNMSSYHHELVRRAMLLSFERDEQDRKQVPKMVKELIAMDILHETDVHHALAMILGKLEDVLKDYPHAEKYLKEMMAQFIVDEILPADLVKQEQILGYGGARGNHVLEDVLHKTPEYSRMVWRGGSDEKELHAEIEETISEYFDAYDTHEVGRILGELHLSKQMEIDFLVNLMVRGLEKGVISATLDLVAYLHSIHWAHSEVMDAIEHIRVNSEELSKDLPKIRELTDSLVFEAHQRNLIESDFLHHRDRHSQVALTV